METERGRGREKERKMEKVREGERERDGSETRLLKKIMVGEIGSVRNVG